jgi:hypothetical protein
VLFQERHHLLEQIVASAVTLRVVDGLQPDDVDVCDDEPSAGPVTAIEFVVKVGQAGRSRACSRQGVGFRDRELACERLAVGQGVPTLARSLFAVQCCGFAVLGGQRVLLSGERAKLFVAPAVPGGPCQAVGFGGGASVVLLRGGALLRCRHEAAGVRGIISGQRRAVAGICDDVALVSGGQAPLSGLITFVGGSVTFIGRLIALIGGVLALIGPSQARFSGLITLVSGLIASIGDVLALIGGVPTYLRGLVTLIGGLIAFIGDLIAMISGLIALIGGVLAHVTVHGVRTRVIDADAVRRGCASGTPRSCDPRGGSLGACSAKVGLRTRLRNGCVWASHLD